jgi:lipopolysaccharide/colanic/teichoic acid biosynthesis glycosyltransferase
MSHATGGGAGPARASRSRRRLSRDTLRPPLKRALDVAVAAPLLLLLAPTFALVFLLVRAGGGPAFASRRRVGRGGREFGHLAFRLPSAGGGLGRALRRTALDELPQLLNVLRGDISLVGPRPVAREELERSYALFRGEAAYLSVRPGLVGPCEVRGGGGDPGPGERVALDVAYAQRPSLRADLAILARALGQVLRGPVAR